MILLLLPYAITRNNSIQKLPGTRLELVHREHLARLHVVLKLLDHVGDIIGGDQIIYDGAYNLKLEDAKPRRKEEKRKERARG